MEALESLEQLLGRPICIRTMRRGNKVLAIDSVGHCVAAYDAVTLAVNWLQMSNDSFFKVYGFNWVPDYETQKKARKIMDRGGSLR